MSGASPTAELLLHLELATYMAFLALWQTWTWVGLLICLLLGAVVRSYYERQSAIVVGIILVTVILALNTAILGIDLADDLDLFRSTWPSYFFPLVMMTCWLLHLPIGLLAAGLGIRAADLVARQTVGRSRPPSDRPRHGSGRTD